MGAAMTKRMVPAGEPSDLIIHAPGCIHMYAGIVRNPTAPTSSPRPNTIRQVRHRAASSRRRLIAPPKRRAARRPRVFPKKLCRHLLGRRRESPGALELLHLCVVVAEHFLQHFVGVLAERRAAL